MAAPPGVGRDRLDVVLVERGLAPTRARAQALVLAGRVRSLGARLDKPGQRVARDAPLEVFEPSRYVSRGGTKLVHALRVFAVEVAGRRVLDVGASTGGFTQALLETGAAAVIALDVGRGQLDWSLRQDPRVSVVEGVNARFLEAPMLPFAPSLATVDVSFISLRTVLPAVAGCLDSTGTIVALIKPQFEVGRGRVGRKGIVRDPALHREVLDEIVEFAGGRGWGISGLCASPIAGAKGNLEFFVHLAVHGPGLAAAALEAALAAALASPPAEAP